MRRESRSGKITGRTPNEHRCTRSRTGSGLTASLKTEEPRHSKGHAVTAAGSGNERSVAYFCRSARRDTGIAILKAVDGIAATKVTDAGSLHFSFSPTGVQTISCAVQRRCSEHLPLEPIVAWDNRRFLRSFVMREHIADAATGEVREDDRDPRRDHSGRSCSHPIHRLAISCPTPAQRDHEHRRDSRAERGGRRCLLNLPLVQL